jgi:hypothetical protein
MNGFISYAHEDYRVFSEFKIHLKAVERECGVRFWADERIAAGYDWTAEIAKAIAAADVCLLLVSAEFIASDYIYDTEIPAVQRRRGDGALVIPVVLRECSWGMLAGVLQAVPTADGHVKPIHNWRPHNDGFNRARSEIAKAIQVRFGATTPPLFGSMP